MPWRTGPGWSTAIDLQHLGDEPAVAGEAAADLGDEHLEALRPSGRAGSCSLSGSGGVMVRK